MNRILMKVWLARSSYINDLPALWSDCAVAALSSTELLVIGGWYGGDRQTMYKGYSKFLHV